MGYVRPTIDEEVLSCQSEYINYMGLIIDGHFYLYPGFHVAKSVKLENLDKTPTLGEITGVLNQYYMNLQPK